MRFDIITIFPDIFSSYFGESILKRAQERELVSVHAHNLRDFAHDKHKTLDDKPYGGGAGMVLKVEPIIEAVEAILKRKKKNEKVKIIILSAKGKQFTQKMAYGWAKKYGRLVMISGRYEGIDERVKKILKAEEISIGPYVLTDGDAAAMVVVSAVARLVPGVIAFESLEEESHRDIPLKKEGKKGNAHGLEYPHYTRPEVLEYKKKKYRVPKALLSGSHKNIALWRDMHRGLPR